MAHYKRKRARTSGSECSTDNFMKRRLGAEYDNWRWAQHNPRSWDKLHHIRPARRRERDLERRVLRGDDPDNLAWPLASKPFIYYW